MIELGEIWLRDEASVVETGEKVHLLARETGFSHFAAVRLASICSEMAGRICTKTKRGSISIGIDALKKKEDTSCHLTFAFRTKARNISIDEANDFFDQVGTSRSPSGFLDLHFTKHIDNPGFSPDKTFIKSAGQIISQMSKEDLFRKIQQKNKALSTALDEIKEKNIALNEANQHKSAFLANMSHEIRTPMNAILGYIQIMLNDAGLKENQKKNLKIIANSGRHLIQLINEILEMSKIEAGRITLQQRTFDLVQMIEDVILMFSNHAEKQGIDFKLIMKERASVIIRQDESKIRQVLINVIGNAFKFTSKGEIALKVDIDSKNGSPQDGNNPQEWFIRCEIRDTGRGIKKEKQPFIFDAFEQAGAGPAEGGTGLGLSISRYYAQLMDGDLLLSKSEVNQGSTFVFTFAAASGKGEEIQAERPVKKVVKLKPGQPEFHILVVDDVEINLDLLSLMLQQIGFHVHFAMSSREAVEKASQISPDAILMDIVMPEMDGIEATKRIKALPGMADIPIIAVSASVLDDQRDGAFNAGCCAFIKKPVNSAELFETLGQHLDLEYVYQAPGENDTDDSLKPSRPQDFKHLPSDMRKQINKAAALGDVMKLKLLAGKVTRKNPATGEALNQLIEKFDLATLKQL